MCSHPVKIIEPVWLDENGKRTLLAQVQYCPRTGSFGRTQGCDRPVGDPKREKGCTSDFGTGWALMLQHHSWAPFVFERKDGYLVPSGVKISETVEEY
jgi:hypothetical protein